MKHTLLLSAIQRRIKKAKVISFDIFDTLLLRPYMRPAHVFEHMERTYDQIGFAQERRDAERRTRVKHPELEDVTLDMIYDEIDASYRGLKQKEMDWEESVLRQNPETKQIFDYAKKIGKTVIITSDIYFPQQFVEKILKANGFSGYDHLYISSQLNAAKSFGTIYRHIIDELKIEPKYILHIGDNQRTDRDAAEKCGINTVLYKQVVARYIDSDRRITNFVQSMGDSLNVSTFIGMMAYRWQQIRCGVIPEEENYFKRLGYTWAGPLAYGYMRFVEQTAIENGINHLLFVARDGYTLQKVFNTFNNKIKSSYIYANGSINRITSLEVSNIDHCHHIVNFFSGFSEELQKAADGTLLKTIGDYKLFFKRNEKGLKPISEKLSNNYHRYVNSLVKKKDCVAVVDSMARTFSSLDLLQRFTGKNMLGIYWVYAKTPAAEKFNFTTFAHTIANEDTVWDKRNADVFTKNWDIMEFFFSSPEQPIKYIKEDGTPQYEETDNKYKLYRAEIYPQISDGMVGFAKDLHDFWKDKEIILDFNLVMKWINSFLSYPLKEDLKWFKKIVFFFGDNDDLIRPIFKQPASKFILKDLLFSKIEKENLKQLKILGLPFYSKKRKGDKVTRNGCFGLIRIVRTQRHKKYYFCGIRIKSKEYPPTLMHLDPFDMWQIIDMVTEKVQRSLTVAFLHQKTFGEFRNKHEGQNVVLVGAGPSALYFKPIKDAVYVGLNRAYLLSSVHFDYLFTIDKGGLDIGTEKFHDGFLNYDCIKFVGDQNLGKGYQIPQSVGNGCSTVRRYKTNAGFCRGKFALDIDTQPLNNSASTSIQAMQFILFTNPKKIYVVGIDCTNSLKQHFIGGAYDNSLRNENVADNDRKHVQAWKDLKYFMSIYYPETEVIVVNPVGLRGIFHDVYTKTYLEKHPEIDKDLVEIIDEKEIKNDNF